MVPHSNSSILAWRIPWIEEADQLQSMRLPRVGNILVMEHACIHGLYWRNIYMHLRTLYTLFLLTGVSNGFC